MREIRDKSEVAPALAIRMGVSLVFFGVVAAEIILLRLSSTAAYMPLRESAVGFDQILAFLPAVVKAMLLTGSGGLVASLVRAPAYILAAVFAHRPSRVTLALNLASFAALIGIFALERIGDAKSDGASGWFPGLIRITPIFWICLLASWASFVAPLSLWRQALHRKYQPWVIVFIASVLSFHRFDAALASQISSLLIKPTLFAATQLYALTGRGLHCVGATPEGYPICGSDAYFVEIQPACSGFQGIILSAMLLGIYFYVEPRKVSAFRAGLVILLSCLATFWLNATRLAALIYIGSHLSPEIAGEGFHTNFGLVNLIVVLVIAAASSKAFTTLKTETKLPAWKATIANLAGDPTLRLLIPLTYLFGSSLFFGLFSGKFFWLYPLPLLATLGGLLQIRAELRTLKFSLTAGPTFLAILTFLVWLLLVPANAEKADFFQGSLLSVPVPVSVGWLSARLLGAVLIVPFAEELAFRGAFNAMFQNALLPYATAAIAQATAITLTAVSFGLFHSNFFAGAIAGVAFGLARWRRDELGDAVLCHGLTNLMLSYYILVTGEWSYWL